MKLTKSDISIHNICIASIKRSTIKPYNFHWTKIWELDFDYSFLGLQNEMIYGEMIICSTVIDNYNYSVLTTRQLITNRNGILSKGDLYGAIDKKYGDFKGTNGNLTTFGQIQLKSGTKLDYFIETGNASMVMIRAVRTLIRILQN